MRNPDLLDTTLGPALAAFLLGAGMMAWGIWGTTVGLRLRDWGDTLFGVSRIAIRVATFAWSLVVATPLCLVWLYELLSVRIPGWQFVLLLGGAGFALFVAYCAGMFNRKRE